MVATRDDILKQMARGKMEVFFGNSVTSSAGTAAGSSSGFLAMTISGQSIGSTYPTTIQEFQTPAGITADTFNILNFQSPTVAGRGSGIARIYKVGTLNLTATGDQFTHDAATFPVTRTEMNVASTALQLIPFIQVTTALTGFAAAFQLQTNAGGAGYKNQVGTSVIGTKTFTFPSATTAVGSSYFLTMNDADYACTDIIQIKVTTAATAGACDVFLFEDLGLCQGQTAGASIYDNVVGSGVRLTNTTPAVATSGTATSYFVTYSILSSSTTSLISNISVLS
jgi:hypothetical protein